MMKTLYAVLTAIALLILVDLPARGVVAALGASLSAAPWWVKPLVRQGIELLIALLAISTIWSGEFGRFGFRFSGDLKIWKSILVSLPLFLVSLIVGGIFASLIMAIAGPTPSYDFGNMNLLQQIVKVWILASIAEEIVFRGLIQTYLSSRVLGSLSFFRLRISHATVIAALMFSLAHFFLLTKGAGAAQMAMIALSTFILGAAAGYFRETTGSLAPAIVVHMLFNVWGSGLQLIVPGAS
ncbi:MAG: CPBP family intramembrane glutamic endopeptidase [bacterium]